MATVSVSGQQFLQVSQYMYNNLLTNPGSAGSMDMICAGAIYRDQFVGFPGRPTNLIFNVEAPFNLLGAKHGAGLSIFRDEIGFYVTNDIRLTYAYRVPMGDGNLGIGASVNFIQKGLENVEWITESDYPIPQDELPSATAQQGNSYGAHAGIFYRSEDFYFGLSSVNIYSKEIEYLSESAAGPSNNSFPNEQLIPHYFATAGYTMQLANPLYEVKPSVLLYSDARITTLDLTGIVEYNKKIWGGVTFRPGAAIVGMIGIDVFEGAKVGYSYDFATSSLTKYSQGTHEFSIHYCFKVGIEKSPQKYKSIRFL
jgi:type IX secretion system PorP/SprF family membrane protein